MGILRRVPIDPAVVFDYAARTFWALVVVIVTLLLARVVRRTTMRALTRGRAQANVTILLGNLVQVAMLTIGALLVLAIYTRDAFGWILGSFSVVGIVLGLSLQDILKNFLAGIWVLVERPFRIGDTIEVGGYSGVVEEITFRTTLLRTVDAQQVIVPNGTFMTSSVVNLTRFPTRRASLCAERHGRQGQLHGHVLDGRARRRAVRGRRGAAGTIPAGRGAWWLRHSVRPAIRRKRSR